VYVDGDMERTEYHRRRADLIAERAELPATQAMCVDVGR
jgi:hypothetical protein